MLRAALLVVAVTAAGAEIPVGAPPLIGGAMDALVFDGSHFVLLQRSLRTSLADDGTPLSSTSGGDRVAMASSGRGTLSISISHGNAYANDTILLAPADAASAAWDGARYAVALRDGHRLALAFVAENGAVGDRIDVADNADNFAVAACNGAVLAAWSSGGSLFARTPSGEIVRIGDGALSDAAAGRDGFLVTTLSGGMLVARHLDLAGHPDAAYTVAPSARGARLVRERYAYALVWPDGNRLLGERIDPFGGTIAGPFTVAALDREIDDVAIAATAATTLVAYSSRGLFAKQIDDTTPAKALPAHAARQSSVHAAGPFVVWQQETSSGSEIRVDDAVAVANGTLEDAAFDGGIVRIIFRDAAGLWSLRWPAGSAPSPMASLPADAESLRVWNDGNTIFAQYPGSDERIVVDRGAAQKGTPHVRWDGAAWVVTWPEIVDAATAGFASMRIGGAKTIFARAPLPISLDDWSDDENAVYYIRDGRLFMQRIDDAAHHRRAAGR